MSKRLEELKNELLKLANAVNAFQSESVQVIIVDWLLTQLKPVSQMMPKASNTAIATATHELNHQPAPENASPKKRGATYLLRNLLASDYFDTGRTLAEILKFINEPKTNSSWQSHQISGPLLKLVDQGKLTRSTGNNKKSFRYAKV